MDKEKVIQELQERTEEIKEKAGELHKAIEETISQKKQMHYSELGGQGENLDVQVKDGYGLVLGGGGGRGLFGAGGPGHSGGGLGCAHGRGDHGGGLPLSRPAAGEMTAA